MILAAGLSFPMFDFVLRSALFCVLRFCRKNKKVNASEEDKGEKTDKKMVEEKAKKRYKRRVHKNKAKGEEKADSADRREREKIDGGEEENKRQSGAGQGRSLQESIHPFIRRVLESAQHVDGEQIGEFLRSLRDNHGFDMGELDEFLVNFNWREALHILPFLVEFAETFNEASGAQKEQLVISMIVKLATLAKQEHYFDEDAIFSLRIIITTIVDVSRGEFRINAKSTSNCFALMKHGGKWGLKHVKCC